VKRDEWVFELPAAKLADAARAKVEFHQQRLGFWKAAQDGVMAEVREKGLHVEESLAGPNYSNMSANYGPQIVVDATYQRKLNEANGKIEEHTRRLREYEGWVQVLDGNGGRMYPLHADDYLYFFGK